jgi:hypothetical protein
VGLKPERRLDRRRPRDDPAPTLISPSSTHLKAPTGSVPIQAAAGPCHHPIGTATDNATRSAVADGEHDHDAAHEIRRRRSQACDRTPMLPGYSRGAQFTMYGRSVVVVLYRAPEGPSHDPRGSIRFTSTLSAPTRRRRVAAPCLRTSSRPRS